MEHITARQPFTVPQIETYARLHEAALCISSAINDMAEEAKSNTTTARMLESMKACAASLDKEWTAIANEVRPGYEYNGCPIEFTYHASPNLVTAVCFTKKDIPEFKELCMKILQANYGAVFNEPDPEFAVFQVKPIGTLGTHNMRPYFDVFDSVHLGYCYYLFA